MHSSAVAGKGLGEDRTNGAAAREEEQGRGGESERREGLKKQSEELNFRP